MALLSSRRRSQPGTGSKTWKTVIIVACGVITAAAVLWTLGVSIATRTRGCGNFRAGTLTNRLGLTGGLYSRTVRKFDAGNTFGTIFHLELSMFYNALTDKPLTEKLVTMLKQMQASGIRTVVFSASWAWVQSDPDKIKFAYLEWLFDAACKNTNLKVDLILDMLHPPKWIWERYPDARVFDADGRNYSRISWFHPLSAQAGRTLLTQVSSHLSKRYPRCAVAIQPVYNNEYEAKFTQEYDAYQDYSPYAIAAYRDWLRTKRPRVELLNIRWGTAFRTWDDVMPPVLHSGDLAGADFSARYWDFLRFREEFGADHYNRACAAVQSGGLQCFHHFPEFFTVLDSIYSASMFRYIAASPHTDFVIMDSNFMTPYGTVMNPHKLRMYISAAHSYGKPVYFEAAVERYQALPLLAAGFSNSLLAGAENVGITNWHTRVEMNASLAAAMRTPPACQACELVGVFVHLESCSAFHGVQWAAPRKDPLHDFMEDLAERLSDQCETDVAVYIELDRFLAAVPTFTRAVFVEPLVLYGSADLEAYVAAKAALRGVPHQVLHLPVNITSGPQLVVMQEL